MDTIKKYWPLILGAVILLTAYLAWFKPSLSKKETIIETKNIKIQELEKEVQTWKNKNVTRIVYYPDGRKKSETVIAEDAGSRTREHTDTVEDTVTKEKIVIVEKRGLFVVGSGINSGGYPSILLQSTLIGPLGLAGTASFQTMPVGIYSGAVFVTVAF